MNANKVVVSAIFIFILITPFVFAKDISLSVNQTDYYVPVKENAIVALQSNNTYDEAITGMLSYTITQTSKQGTFQYSSSNTKSISIPINKGLSKIPLNFGTSDSPLTLTANLKFSYTKDGPREVVLKNFVIHFIQTNVSNKNVKNEISSSSQKASSSASQQQNPLSSQQQQMQQTINKMFGNQQQSPSSQQQTTQQKLQNNQMAQDSSALKQEMQQQAQEQQKMKDAFQKELAKNNAFQKEHQNLLQQGYNITSANLNPSNNNTGGFSLKYKNKAGENASLQGQMTNGTMQQLQKSTPESRQQAMQKAMQDKKFQELAQQLKQQGFTQKNVSVSPQLNKTLVQAQYANKNNETANIQATLVNESVKNVTLTKKFQRKKESWWWLLTALIAGSIAFFLFRKKKKTIKQKEKSSIPEKKEIPFDYKKESELLLNKAKRFFEKKEYKDAYASAGQALRLFLSYENKLNKEVTNDEIIAFLQKHKKSHQEIKKCFDLCSLVEFAKYQANKKDFDKILQYAQKVILSEKNK